MPRQNPSDALARANLLHGIRARYPHLSTSEQEELANDLMDEVGRRLGEHEDLAFVRKRNDGRAEIEIWNTRSIRKKL